MISNKKLIKAAQTLQNNCKKRKDNEICNDCPFLIGGFCSIEVSSPDYWDLGSVYIAMDFGNGD